MGRGMCASCYQTWWRKQHPGRKYGVKDETYFAALAAQDGKCAICLQLCTKRSRLSVDHDHATKAFRGLLCDACNNGLGRFNDDPAVLQRAIGYLAGRVQ